MMTSRNNYQQVIKGMQTGNYPKNTYPKGNPSMQEQCARFRYYIKNLQHYDALSDVAYYEVIKNWMKDGHYKIKSVKILSIELDTEEKTFDDLTCNMIVKAKINGNVKSVYLYGNIQDGKYEVLDIM